MLGGIQNKWWSTAFLSLRANNSPEKRVCVWVCLCMHTRMSVCGYSILLTWMAQ